MIAVDAMGGDNAPTQIVQGALLAAKRGIAIALFGPESEVVSCLSKQDTLWRKENIVVCDAPQVVEMGEDPVSAIRNKKDSSLVRAMQSVKLGESNAFVGAGNSGAIMIASTFILGKKQGVHRPAIIGRLPIGSHDVLCLDLGANADCRPEYLEQFAYMGNGYAKEFLGIKSPRIALLSNGREQRKGSILVKQVFSLLQDSNLNFVGNIEPEGVFAKQADVVVCDGFSGNILLKTIEATAYAVGKKDYASKLGGALLAGVCGTVVVAHGNSSANATENAILFAYKNCLKKEESYGIFKKSNDRMDAQSL